MGPYCLVSMTIRYDIVHPFHHNRFQCHHRRHFSHPNCPVVLSIVDSLSCSGQLKVRTEPLLVEIYNPISLKNNFQKICYLKRKQNTHMGELKKMPSLYPQSQTPTQLSQIFAAVTENEQHDFFMKLLASPSLPEFVVSCRCQQQTLVVIHGLVRSCSPYLTGITGLYLCMRANP